MNGMNQGHYLEVVVETYQSLYLFQPEWYFTQVLSWIRDHMDFMEKRIQPLLIEAGKSSIDAKVRLIIYNGTSCADPEEGGMGVRTPLKNHKI